MKDMTGPGSWEQWTSWKSRTESHRKRLGTKYELEKILHSDQVYCHMVKITTFKIKASNFQDFPFNMPS